MSEKRMVIIDHRLMHKIDEHRGRLSRSGFIGGCVKRLLSELESESKGGATVTQKRLDAEIASEPVEYATREEFEQFKWNMDKLQEEFTDFFIKYGQHLAGGRLSKEETERFSEELKGLLQL